jgi:hypothetical protein
MADPTTVETGLKSAMTATTTAYRPRLDPAIRTSLAALRRRIRRYVWIEGLAAAAAWLGLAFWLSLLVDWFFEPPPPARAALLAAIGVVLAAVLVRMIVRRVFVPLSDANMAMLIERRFPALQESLLTAVELDGREFADEPWLTALLDRTAALAAKRMREVELSRIFDPGPLRRAVCAALLLAASAAALAALEPASLGIWWRRVVCFSGEIWPRRTRLSIEGFQHGRIKVARGSDVDILVRADTRMPSVPQVVQVRYRIEGGVAGRASMNRLGNANPALERFQEYSYTFRNVLTPIALDVFGGDDSKRDLRIEVVDSPALVKMSLDCRFPAYTRFAPRQVPVSGAMQLPEGTQVTIRARANKDLVRVAIESALDEQPGPPELLDLSKSGDRRNFQYTIARLDKDKTLLFTLLDDDGIRSREPVRLSLAAIVDEPPRLAVQLQGIGTAVTPKARLPVAGRVTDDYGLARLWYEYGVDRQPPAVRPIALAQDGLTDLALSDALDLRELKLEAGHKFQLVLKAADAHNLGKGPNIGVGERWQLDLVTPEQLRALLESRELVLRQRFEAIIAEVVETRDLLERIEFAEPAATGPGDATPGLKSATPRPKSAVEPGDESGSRGDDSPERLVALRAVRVERAVQNSRKNAQETLGVADAFEEIRQQLVNNRIDTEELIERVKGGIADPLRAVGDSMFPELDRRLDQLRAALSDAHAGPENRQRARQQTDAIVLAMRQVLARMVELESFNEAVEILRSIIEEQAKLSDHTKQLHKQKLRDLLKE